MTTPGRSMALAVAVFLAVLAAFVFCALTSTLSVAAIIIAVAALFIAVLVGISHWGRRKP